MMAWAFVLLEALSCAGVTKPELLVVAALVTGVVAIFNFKFS
jgi:hypothetical protein